MKRRNHLSTMFWVAVTSVTLAAGCDNCDTPPNVPDPSVGKQATAPSANLDKLEKHNESAGERLEAMPADDKKMEQVPPLEEAMSAPDDAVTSEGRFAALMEEGLAEHIPKKGLVFAMGGAEEPAVRVGVDADGQVRWARGKGGFWDPLGKTGEAILDQAQRKKLADLVEQAWSDRDLEYPPTTPNRGELLVLRDGDVARVIESSYLPRELAPLRDMLVGFAHE